MHFEDIFEWSLAAIIGVGALVYLSGILLLVLLASTIANFLLELSKK